MKSLLLAALSLVILTGASVSDPIAERRALMKRYGSIGRGLFEYVQGGKAYDAAAVLASLQALDADAAKFDVAALFPDGSGTGDTKASPKIWEDLAAFQAAADKFKGDVAKGVAAAPQDIGAFEPVLDMIANDCRSCHAAWRQ
jgi:cytochrome c556